MTVAGLMRQWRTGEIRGLSLRQPHASLVALGEKRIETRSFARKYRGAVAIASSAAWNRTARIQAAEAPSFTAAWRRHRGLVDDVDDLPLGMILAVARIVDYVPTETIVAANTDFGPRSRLCLGDFRGGRSERAFGDYGPNRFGWLLADVHRVREPVPCKGRLGLWKIDSVTLRLLRRASVVPAD
jgi:activating signal cointegrator 1